MPFAKVLALLHELMVRQVRNGLAADKDDVFEYYRSDERSSRAPPTYTYDPRRWTLVAMPDCAWLLERLDTNIIIMSLASARIRQKGSNRVAIRYHVTLCRDSWKTLGEFHVTVERITNLRAGAKVATLLCRNYHEVADSGPPRASPRASPENCSRRAVEAEDVALEHAVRANELLCRLSGMATRKTV
jgi:hypothetical protein